MSGVGMLTRPELPKSLTVAAAAPRGITSDGRLVIPWNGGYSAGVEAATSRAASYALALDILAKKPADAPPGRYTFRLQDWAIGAPGRLDYWDGYGILVPFPLDWVWFVQHAEIEGGEMWPRHPDEDWPRRIGPGAGPGILRGDELPPVGWEQIDSAADISDPKWSAVGFGQGEPWTGRLPRLNRHERRAVKDQGAGGSAW